MTDDLGRYYILLNEKEKRYVKKKLRGMIQEHRFENNLHGSYPIYINFSLIKALKSSKKKIEKSPNFRLRLMSFDSLSGYYWKIAKI